MDPKSLDELSSRLNKEIVRYTLETNRKLQKALHERALKLEGDLKEFDLLLVRNYRILMFYWRDNVFIFLNSGDFDCGRCRWWTWVWIGDSRLKESGWVVSFPWTLEPSRPLQQKAFALYSYFALISYPPSTRKLRRGRHTCLTLVPIHVSIPIAQLLGQPWSLRSQGKGSGGACRCRKEGKWTSRGLQTFQDIVSILLSNEWWTY